MSYFVVLRAGSPWVIIGRMSCPEYVRLRQQYEASLRHWAGGGGIFAYKGVLGSSAAVQMVAEALEQRDASHDRVGRHRQTCLVCNPQVTHSSK